MIRLLLYPIAILLSLGAQSRASEIRDHGGWYYQVTPYVWMASLSGNVSATQSPVVFEVDKSFDEILETLDGAFFVSALARKDRFILFADFNYVATNESEASPVPLFESITAEVKQLTGTLASGMRVIDAPAGSLDVLAGVRGWHVDAELSGRGGPLGPLTESDSWSFVDPVVAARGRVVLSESLSALTHVDVGGFGVGSDFSWQIAATLNYTFSDRIVLSAGYRHLAVDYNDGGQVLDVELSGPLLGATLRF